MVALQLPPTKISWFTSAFQVLVDLVEKSIKSLFDLICEGFKYRRFLKWRDPKLKLVSPSETTRSRLWCRGGCVGHWAACGSLLEIFGTPKFPRVFGCFSIIHVRNGQAGTKYWFSFLQVASSAEPNDQLDVDGSNFNSIVHWDPTLEGTKQK